MTAPDEPGTAPVFVPWPLVPAIGACLGVVIAAQLKAALVPAFAIGLCALGIGLWWRASWRWPHAFTGIRPAALMVFLPVVLLTASAGALRWQAWQTGVGERARAQLTADWVGEEREWVGRSDGEVLHATAPFEGRLAIVMPGGARPPTGQLRLVGTAEAAPGARNPGGFDYAAHLARRGVAGQLFVREVNVVRARVGVTERLASGIRAGLPPDSAALMLAMSIGRRDDLGDLRDTFGAAGMAHLLALSGLHVGVLLVFFGKALGRLPRARLPLIALGTAAFVALVGPSPSVVRAATMALSALASTALGAGRAGPTATLSLALLIGVLTAPQMVFDLGFQLSYLAVAGMLLYLPPWTERIATHVGPAPIGLDRWRRLVRVAGSAAVTGALVSVAAQLPTLSLVAGTFLSVPLASPLVNVLAVPIAGLLVPLGFLAGLVGLVAEPLARMVNLAVMPLAGALVWLAEVGARLPRLAWGEVTAVGHVAWALFAVALAAWSRRRLRFAQVLALGLVVGGTTYALPARYSQPDIWFLDVGQGDAVLLRVGPGATVLVDGGGSPFSDYDVGARVVVPALRALGVTHLSAVINTHADADHAEGLIAVLETFSVGLFITGPPQPGNALDEQLRALAAARGVPTHEARRGERLEVGDALLEFVNPPAQTSQLGSNDGSVAFVLRYAGEARALFLGDLGVAVEPDLPVPPLDVLMVGHHGSRGSTSPELVRAVGPRLAVISVGRNTYGHPVPEVVERLTEHGAQVLTTREHGAIRVVLGTPTSWKAIASGERGAAVAAPSRGSAGTVLQPNR